MRSPVGPFLAVCVASAVLAPALASAQISAQGSPLTATANYPYNCDTRWVAGYGNNPGGFRGDGYQDFIAEDFFALGGGTVRSSCTIFQTGATVQTSHIVPNSGKVTLARVKSGPNPAPVSIATVRQFTGKRPSDGQLVTTCCQGISETPTVNLTPNAVTEIPVNFLVESKPYDPQNPGVAGYRDWVVVNVDVTTGGTLPIHDNGLPRPIGPVATDQGATWHFPQIDPSQTNQNAWIANGFEVLMNFDWVPADAPSPTPDPTPNPNPTPAPCGGRAAAGARAAACMPANLLVQVPGTKASFRRGKVSVAIRCSNPSNGCKGKVRLRTAAKKPLLLASKSLTIANGKTRTVSLTLGAKARKRLKGKSKVRVEVALDGLEVVAKVVKLAR
ncbi:MAG: hypothetical protein V9E83_02010 [Baekduia sp.]